MRITALPTGTVASSDYFAADNTTNGTRKIPVNQLAPIHRSDSITSLPKTISVTGCTTNHRVVAPLITGATTSFVLAWSTASGSVTFSLSSGTFSSCTVDYNLEITQ